MTMVTKEIAATTLGMSVLELQQKLFQLNIYLPYKCKNIFLVNPRATVYHIAETEVLNVKKQILRNVFNLPVLREFIAAGYPLEVDDMEVPVLYGVKRKPVIIRHTTKNLSGIDLYDELLSEIRLDEVLRRDLNVVRVEIKKLSELQKMDVIV
jgi:hypothetical protein